MNCQKYRTDGDDQQGRANAHWLIITVENFHYPSSLARGVNETRCKEIVNRIMNETSQHLAGKRYCAQHKICQGLQTVEFCSGPVSWKGKVEKAEKFAGNPVIFNLKHDSKKVPEQQATVFNVILYPPMFLIINRSPVSPSLKKSLPTKSRILVAEVLYSLDERQYTDYKRHVGYKTTQTLVGSRKANYGSGTVNY